MAGALGVLGIVTGIVALVAWKSTTNVIWAILFIVLGYLSGGIGGILVLIGGIIGLLIYMIANAR